MNRPIFLFLFFLISIATGAQNISPSVFNSGKGSENHWLLYKNNDEALYKIITDKAFALLDERKVKTDQLQTRADWLSYQTELKEKYGESLKKFTKTPLNARVTGTLKRDGFTVEKIVFESHPGFYVTSCLFLPKKRQKPAPAVIYCSGHTELGFRSEVYQRVILNLVEKGFVVFAFDPIGQGERLQYPDPETGKSKVGGSTTEHSYAGIQTLLTGTSLSDYFIWDGVRAIDYLETRKEVDAKRIGITGRSGGGTQSAEIAAYDERIYAAAPECYITNFKRLLQSIGPQDAEQNPYHFIEKGMDHPDFLHIRAPRPTLIVTTTHDFFSQQGARETFAEARKSYAALGYPENIQKVEDFGVHESTKNNREAVYAFFQKYLDLPGDNTDQDVTPFTMEELWVTTTGQVGTSLKGETVFSLNQKYFSKQMVAENELKEKIKAISGIEFNRKLTAAVYTGKIPGDAFDVKKYFLENDKNDFVLPLYVIEKPQSKTEKTLLWLPEEGKQNVPNDPLLAKLLAQNYRVITPDLPDIGEFRDPDFRGDGFVKGVPFNYTFGANLIGKSITGIRAEVLDLLVQFVQSEYPDIKIDALAEGGLSEVILHYSVLKKGISKMVLEHPLELGRNLIQTEYYDPQDAYNVVPGSLPYYDLADLVKLMPANSVKIVKSGSTKSEGKYMDKNNSGIIEFLK